MKKKRASDPTNVTVSFRVETALKDAVQHHVDMLNETKGTTYTWSDVARAAIFEWVRMNNYDNFNDRNTNE